jgi:hypothetical protein
VSGVDSACPSISVNPGILVEINQRFGLGPRVSVFGDPMSPIALVTERPRVHQMATIRKGKHTGIADGMINRGSRFPVVGRLGQYSYDMLAA